MCNLAVSVMKSGNGLRNVALAAEEYRAGCPVFQTLPQLFKPNFSHPNNPQLFSALSLLSYFKLSLKQECFSSQKSSPHWTATVCYVKPHNSWLSEVEMVEIFFLLPYNLHFFVFLQNVGCRKEVHTDGDAYQQPHTHTHM